MPPQYDLTNGHIDKKANSTSLDCASKIEVRPLSGTRYWQRNKTEFRETYVGAGLSCARNRRGTGSLARCRECRIMHASHDASATGFTQIPL
jgi:hypothetical protein